MVQQKAWLQDDFFDQSIQPHSYIHSEGVGNIQGKRFKTRSVLLLQFKTSSCFYKLQMHYDRSIRIDIGGQTKEHNRYEFVW